MSAGVTGVSHRGFGAPQGLAGTSRSPRAAVRGRLQDVLERVRCRTDNLADAQVASRDRCEAALALELQDLSTRGTDLGEQRVRAHLTHRALHVKARLRE